MAEWHNQDLLNEADSFIQDHPDQIKSIQEAFVSNSMLGVALRSIFGFDLTVFMGEWESAETMTESPIESLLLRALFVQGSAFGLPVSIILNSIPQEQILSPFYEMHTDHLYVLPQYEIKFEKKYRLDFLFIANNREGRGGIRKLIVECDGHDFHERTKEQAASDKSRDRDLMANGFQVFRFTGSEIFKNPFACADQICKYMSRLRRA